MKSSVEESDHTSVFHRGSHSGLAPENYHFSDVLTAPGPLLGLKDKLELFGQFVGSWDAHLINHQHDDVLPREVDCEWHFSWILGGRAVQDVWVAPKRALREPGDLSSGEWGTMVRFYDCTINAWRCTWHGPGRGVVRPFLARPIGDQIVQEGVFQDQGPTRWIFSRITPESFYWQSLLSTDDWRTAELLQEMYVTRQNV